MARLIAAACFVAALLAGSIAARPPAAGPGRTSGAYTVIAGDFHVHAYPLDGALPWWEIASEARRRGLDVVAITDHNRIVFRLKPEATRLDGASGFSRKDRALLIPGEEITTPRGHIAAVGLADVVGWRGPRTEIIARVHAEGGVAIIAHPIGSDADNLDDATLASADGIEAAHPAMFVRDWYRIDLIRSYERARTLRPSMAAIGSTDFHFWQPVGLCRTYLFVTSVDRDGVLDAIRSGRTVACDATGAVYGPAGLAAETASLCAADTAAAAHANRRVERASALLALAALAAIVLF